MNFNKKRCLNNIYYLMKESGKKISDIEKAAGVSAGYLSRLNKEDNNTIPSIEFLMSVAEELGVSVDVLVNSDMGELTPTEKYVLNFVKKLQKDTVDKDLDWKIASMPDNRLCYPQDDSPTPDLYTLREVYVPGETEYPDLMYFEMYTSRFCPLGKIRHPLGSCFELAMPGGAVLYLVSVTEDDIPDPIWEDLLPFGLRNGLELYLVRHNQVNPLCAGMEDEKTVFAIELKNLHDRVVESVKHTKISGDARESIEAFMKGLELEEDLPFN